MNAIAIAKPFALTCPCESCLGTGHEINQRKLGAHLRALRKERKRSGRSVAQRLKVDETYITHLEAGRANWTLPLLVKFVAACR